MIKVATDFTEIPGPRAKDEGPFSGEEFLTELLKPAFEDALSNNKKILIDLDGTEGYATSFLESAFGGLAREFGSDSVLGHLEFKSNEEPYLIEEIRIYIREANTK